MVLIVKKLILGYFWLFNERADPRVDNYFLMSSPLYAILIGCGYLYLVNDWFPKFMKNRPTYKLDNVLIVYNVVQIMLNAYISYEAIREIMTLNWFCAPIDYSVTPHTLFVIKIIYLYFLLKVLDLLNTVFFILRGKKKQVTFLHVYHHFGMATLSWIGVKFFAGGHSIFVGFNCVVHTVMYFYYFLTIWKPEYKANIWWKKHITHLQLVQFVIFSVVFSLPFLDPECTYPKVASYFFVPQNIFMIILFSDFYWKAYVRPRRGQEQK